MSTGRRRGGDGPEPFVEVRQTWKAVPKGLLVINSVLVLAYVSSYVITMRASPTPTRERIVLFAAIGVALCATSILLRVAHNARVHRPKEPETSERREPDRPLLR